MALAAAWRRIATLIILLAMPQVILGLLGGVFADRWERKTFHHVLGHCAPRPEGGGGWIVSE